MSRGAPSTPEPMSPAVARALWHALVDNAGSLIEDAGALLVAGSAARARSLVVLAQEELGKALWLWETFEAAWSDGSTAANDVTKLGQHGRSHIAKYMSAYRFGDELASFWGDYASVSMPGEGESWEHVFERQAAEAEAAAREANAAKQAGFYVDLAPDGTIQTPRYIPSDGVRDELQLAAQVIEMLLIMDHSRMKDPFDERDGAAPYDYSDSAQHVHARLLPYAHPQEYRAAMEAAERRTSSGAATDVDGGELGA